MARAILGGWDQPEAPHVPARARTIERYKWQPGSEPASPQNQQQRPQPLSPDGQPAEVVIGVSGQDEDEKTCPELVYDLCTEACRRSCQAIIDFFAGWFGAVHLQHFSAADANLDLPMSAAARELREMAMSGSKWSSNFFRLNPKAAGHPKGWSGAHRIRQGWAGDPNPRPESVNYWKHTFGMTDGEPMVTRQHLPGFIVLQCLVCLGLWVIFRLRDGKEEAGLESIWPGMTDLCLQWDCEDYRHEAWRWWSYQFTHVGIGHIGGNCIMALFFGINLEGVHGWLRMFLMFNIGVFGGSCCYFVADVHTRVVGMSGGCYALVGMHFGDVLMNFNEQKRAAEHFSHLPPEQKKHLETLWRKMIIAPRKKLVALIFFVTVDLMQSYLTRGGGVSLSAHFGGFVAGFLICIVIGHNLVVKGNERLFWISAFLSGVGLVLFCLFWAFSWPPKDIFSQVPWCWGRQIANFSAFGDDKWHCVRCSSKECIARWEVQRYIETVSDRTCQNNGGWHVTDG